MRHALGRIIGVFPHQPACNLLRRPFARQLGRYSVAKILIACQRARFGAMRTVPGRLIGLRCAIPGTATIAANLATDRRWSPSKMPCNGTQRLLRLEPSGNLLTLRKRQGQPRSSARRRADATGARQKRIYRRRGAIKSTANRTHRSPALPTLPNLRLLFVGEKYTATILHASHSIFQNRSKWCGDRLNRQAKRTFGYLHYRWQAPTVAGRSR